MTVLSAPVDVGRGRVLDDADIVLHSCLVFEGPLEEVALRAEALARYFGVRSGTIYGPTTLEDNFPAPLSREGPAFAARTAATFLALSAALLTLFGAPLVDALKVGGALASFAAGLVLLIMTFSALVKHGVFLRWRDGVLVETHSVRRTRHLARR